MIISLFRTVILYLIIIISLRLMGKRQIGQLETSELVVAILISDLAAVPMQDIAIPLLSGAIPILTLVSMEMLFSALMLKSFKIRKLICGKPTMIIECGRLLYKNMNKTRFTIDELIEALRMQGITDIATVQYAFLETTGKLSVLQYPDEKPPTATDMGISPADNGLPTIFINDGRIINKNINQKGFDDKWLEKQLRQYGYSSHTEVFLMSLDEGGNIYICPKGVSEK